jgi:branched-chain amino acid transport system ATP-binding protein
MNDDGVLLRVSGVAKRFGGLQALEDVSFDVMRGEILALIGPNGAGKSTLLNIISGFVAATAGEVHFRGECLKGLSPGEVNARGLARTFQGADALRNMTVRENVITAGVARCGSGIAAGMLGIGHARRTLARLSIEADEHLKLVRLDSVKDIPAMALGAGQQRLLGVARALATGAELLVLDEPGAGLNATEKSFLASVIHRLRDMGKTVLFVDHDLGFVDLLADRTVVLDYGRVIAAGLPAAVRTDAKVIEAYLGNTEIVAPEPPADSGTHTKEVPPLLEIRNLGVRYDGSQALKDVSISIAPNEIVALVGANGAGKSTLLKVVAGIVNPGEGRILLDGHDLAPFPAADRVSLGLSLAPEGRALFGALTVLDNLALGRYGRRRTAGLRQLLAAGSAERESERELLAMVYGFFPRLQQRAKQAAGTLSGGEGQMLAIGRALMNRPRLLMLDEPSFGLAPQLAREIIEALPRLAATGVAILLVEQNARAALQISGRGYVLVNGRIAASGRSRALQEDPEIARTYLGCDGGLVGSAQPSPLFAG